MQPSEYTEEGYAQHMLEAYKDKCRDADEIKLYRALESALIHIDFMRARIKDKLLEHQIEKSDLENMIVKIAKLGTMGLDPEYSQFVEVRNFLDSILFKYRKVEL